jgi:hypothetical protein
MVSKIYNLEIVSFRTSNQSGRQKIFIYIPSCSLFSGDSKLVQILVNFSSKLVQRILDSSYWCVSYIDFILLSKVI